MSETTMTRIAENARLELLRRWALWRDMVPRMKELAPQVEWERPQPLGAGYLNPERSCGNGKEDDLYDNKWEDIVLAARECAAIGHLELHGRDRESLGWWDSQAGNWCVKITDAGYDWIKAHDAIGESRHE